MRFNLIIILALTLLLQTTNIFAADEAVATTTVETSEISLTGTSGCGILTFEGFLHEIAEGRITFTKPDLVTGRTMVTNNTSCYFPVSLSVFTIDDLNDVADRTADHPGPFDFTYQTLFDATVGIVVPPHASTTLGVKLPSCNFQMDVFYGDNYPSNLNRDGMGPYFLDDGHGNTYAIDMEMFGGKVCPRQKPTLTINKLVVNDNGGTKIASNFLFTYSSASSSLATTTGGSTITLEPGEYTVTEIADPSYKALSWQGDCDVNGKVVLTWFQNKTCTITNDDIGIPGGNSTTTPPTGTGTTTPNGNATTTPVVTSNPGGSGSVSAVYYGGQPSSSGGVVIPPTVSVPVTYVAYVTPGTVLGATTIPETPELPNTGSGGSFLYLVVSSLLVSLGLIIVGLSLRRSFRAL
jgi:hypothetical protein